MDDTSRPHPIDDFLQESPDRVAHPDLRETLRSQTTRLLRRRRWWRRARLAGALAACYLAGILTTRFVTPVREAPPPEIVQQEPQPALPEGPALVEAEAPAKHESALTLEWRAFEATERRAELYRLAGDRYLEREGNLQSALRCYRQALDAGTEESLTISTNDTWLLMALKEARQKEKPHVQNDG